MVEFIKKNIFIILIFFITLFVGFVTFLTFIDKSFIELNDNNLQYLLSDLKKSKPPSSKGVFISKVSMSSTMGPGLEIDISSLNF